MKKDIHFTIPSKYFYHIHIIKLFSDSYFTSLFWREGSTSKSVISIILNGLAAFMNILIKSYLICGFDLVFEMYVFVIERFS